MGKTSNFQQTAKQTAVIGGVLVGACVLGAAIAGASGSSQTDKFLFVAVVIAAIGAAVYFVLDLPVITVVRFAFIASFFFKAEVSLFKIDEIEDPSGLNVSLALITSVILLIHDHFADKSREKIFPTAVSFLIAGLFVCGAISIVQGGAKPLGWFALWSFSTSILIALAIASHFSTRERLTQLVLGVAAGLLFTGLVASSQYAFNFPKNLAFFGTGTEDEMLGTQSAQLSRVPAFLRTPTGMAMVVSSLLPVIVATIICRVKNFESWQKNLLWLAAPAGIIGVILSLARGSWISLVIALAIVVCCGWIRLPKSEKRNYFLSAAGAFVLFAAILVPFAPRIYERLTGDDEGSAMVRVPLLETAGRMIQGNALVGVGLNGYRSNMERYDETEIFVTKVFPAPVHNVFAHVTAEIGVPGGVLFCLLFLTVLYECFKAMSDRDRLIFAVALGTAAGIIAYIISAMKEPGSLGSVRPPMRTLFFLFGMILAISRIRRRLFL